MDIRKQFAVAHSRANADLILKWLEQDSQRTAQLMEIVSDTNPMAAKVRQRACMVLGDLGRKQPDWFIPYHGQLLALADAATHPSLPRAVTRYFSELPLGKVSEKHQGVLLDLSFKYLADPEETVTIRVYSMTTLANFAVLYPELKDEIRGLLQREMEEGEVTPGFRSRARKTLTRLQ